MSNPSWAPSLAQVAAYVPTRTLDLVSNPGAETYQGTFNTNTTPTDVIVNNLIADACAWVQARAGITIDTNAQPQATATAALRAAAFVELSFPRNEDDVNTGQALLDQASAELVALTAMNGAQGNGAFSIATSSAAQSYIGQAGTSLLDATDLAATDFDVIP